MCPAHAALAHVVFNSLGDDRECVAGQKHRWSATLTSSSRRPILPSKLAADALAFFFLVCSDCLARQLRVIVFSHWRPHANTRFA